MSRNAISASPEHYIFKIFRESMPPDPPGRPTKNLSRRRVAQNFFSGSTPPQTRNPVKAHVLRTLFNIQAGEGSCLDGA